MVRNILSVIAGWLSWGILCNMILFPILVYMFPDQFDNLIPQTTGMVLTSLIMTFICSIIAGYIIGLVAASNHLKMIKTGAAVNFVFAIVVQISYWDTMPVWYHIIFLASIMPLMILGGKERLKRL